MRLIICYRDMIHFVRELCRHCDVTCLIICFREILLRLCDELLRYSDACAEWDEVDYCIQVLSSTSCKFEKTENTSRGLRYPRVNGKAQSICLCSTNLGYHWYQFHFFLAACGNPKSKPLRDKIIILISSKTQNYQLQVHTSSTPVKLTLFESHVYWCSTSKTSNESCWVPLPWWGAFTPILSSSNAFISWLTEYSYCITTSLWER